MIFYEEQIVNIKLICEKGGRPYNQDFADYAVAGDYVCLAVADGLGAYDGSEAASEAAVRRVITAFRKAVKKEEDLFSGVMMNKLFKLAHAAVHKVKADTPELHGACTTLSIVITHQNKLICAHIGDSRIYFFKDNTVEFYSKDHSLSRLAAERGEITFDEIRTHKDQNKLTRVLGSDYYVQPDFKIYENFTDKDCLLVCTDGLWEYVVEAEMEDALRTTDNAEDAMAAMCKIHDEFAPNDCDNYSAILLRLSSSDVADEKDSSTPNSDGEDKKSSNDQDSSGENSCDEAITPNDDNNE